MQPASYLFPESQASLPKIKPSPHFGTQTPKELGENPIVAQAVQWVADLHVLQEPGQLTHPRLASKY